MDFASFVLAAVTRDLTEEPLAREAADAIEFRMDLAADPLEQLDRYDGILPVIATNRLEAEGGGAPAGAGRRETLAAAAEHPSVEAVDIELATVEDDDAPIARATAHGTSVIVSAHDFDATPPRGELGELLRRASDRGDVGKLAVTASGPADVLALLEVTLGFAERGIPVATMAMGTAGRHSRAIAPLYGSRIGYAPIDPAAATAPGQYDLATLRSLLDELGLQAGESAEE